MSFYNKDPEMSGNGKDKEHLKTINSDRLLGLYHLCTQDIAPGKSLEDSNLQETLKELNDYRQEILRRMKAGNNGQ